MTGDEIKRLAEETLEKMCIVDSDVPTSSALREIIESALLQVAPSPLPEIGREELGKMLRQATLDSRAEVYGSSYVSMFDSYDRLSDKMKRTYDLTAQTFTASLSTSLRRNEGVCSMEWSTAWNCFKASCGGEHPYNTLKSAFKFCPFCGKPIQEAK